MYGRCAGRMMRGVGRSAMSLHHQRTMPVVCMQTRVGLDTRSAHTETESSITSTTRIGASRPLGGGLGQLVSLVDDDDADDGRR